MDKSIEALFGSKTRVKLLNLFLTNPDKSFYVREITRLIDEQVNSVRRELKNLEEFKVVKSTTEDRKLFYGINQRFKYYIPLRGMFAGAEIPEIETKQIEVLTNSWSERISKIKNSLDVFVISGVLVEGSESNIDMLLVGDDKSILSSWASEIEKEEGRELNYVVLSMEDFYYRYTTRDTFIAEIFSNEYRVIVDNEELLKP
jgi:Fe2+ or Zn2+ uptake regulation protein